jgi:hypothetical protein
MTASVNTSPACPLGQAKSELSGLRRAAWTAFVVPPALSVASVLLVRRFDPTFLHNPILMGVLGLFVLGQILLVWQLAALLRRVSTGIVVLERLEASGRSPDLDALESSLLSIKPDPMRELVLGWIQLERKSHGEGALELLQNSIDRRSLRDHAALGVHALINRVVLKVGFLGTLVGLLFTFPPMKRAVLGLSGSDGEMTFIRDIAKAIDEDAYAIQATLVATGLSLLLEAVVVQILERFYGRFELVESLVSDWNLTVLRPSVRKSGASPATGTPEDNLRLQARLAQGQQILDAHLQQLLETLRKTGESVEVVARSQAGLERRVTEIVAWEKDYRSFLATKDKAAAPSPRMSEH